MWETIIVKVVYPLLEKAMVFIYNSYLIKKHDDITEAKQFLRSKLLKDISEAQNDEERRLLSISLFSLRL